MKKKYIYIHKNLDSLFALDSFIHNCFEIRNNKATLKVLRIYIHKAVDVLHTYSSLFISETSFILTVACMPVCLVLFFNQLHVIFLYRQGSLDGELKIFYSILFYS